MGMTTTGEPLNLSAPTATDTPGWIADFAGNARKTNDFAQETNDSMGELSILTTTAKESLVAAINEIQGFREGTLDSMEEINANTREMVPAGALSLKEAVTNLDKSIKNLSDSLAELNRNILHGVTTVTTTASGIATINLPITINGEYSFIHSVRSSGDIPSAPVVYGTHKNPSYVDILLMDVQGFNMASLSSKQIQVNWVIIK